MQNVRYTIRCPEHTPSDGRLMGEAGLWTEDYAEAETMAQNQTAHHREVGLDCVFEVVTDEYALDITPRQALEYAGRGVDVVEAVEAGLVTIDGKGREQFDATG